MRPTTASRHFGGYWTSVGCFASEKTYKWWGAATFLFDTKLKPITAVQVLNHFMHTVTEKNTIPQPTNQKGWEGEGRGRGHRQLGQREEGGRDS